MKSFKRQFIDAYMEGHIKVEPTAPCHCDEDKQGFNHEDLCLFCSLEYEVWLDQRAREEIDEQLMEEAQGSKKIA